MAANSGLISLKDCMVFLSLTIKAADRNQFSDSGLGKAEDQGSVERRRGLGLTKFARFFDRCGSHFIRPKRW